MFDSQKFYYLNNYYRCRINCFLDQKIMEYIDNAVHIEIDSLLNYLLSFKSMYNHSNYMFILESIFNYIFQLLGITYSDYCLDGRNINTSVVLYNIRSRLAIINKLYYA